MAPPTAMMVHQAVRVRFVSDPIIADPVKLLSIWEEWERGDTNPGRMIADLKLAGLPDLLRELVAAVR